MHDITKNEILSLNEEKIQLLTKYKDNIKKLFEENNIDIGPTELFTIDDEDPAPGIFARTIQTKQDVEDFKKGALELLKKKLELPEESTDPLEFQGKDLSFIFTITRFIDDEYNKLIKKIDVIEEKQCDLIKDNQFIQYKDAKLELKIDAYTNLNNQEKKFYNMIIDEINNNPDSINKIKRKL
jgi:DNA replication initiation complex subunit (GINS family)